MNNQYSPKQIADWQESDRLYHYHAMTSPSNHRAGAKGTFLTHADGIHLYDSEGKCYLDALSGLGNVNIGYGNNKVAEAVAEAIRELSFQNTYFGATNRWGCEVVGKLATHLPGGFDQVFFANSGSEANESAIKIAWHYWALRGKPSKKQIVARDKGYHGTTIFACSLTGLGHYHTQFALPIETPLISMIGPACWWQYGCKLSPEDYGLQAARELEAHILEVGADNVAAFIAEPIAGAGGMHIPPPGYWAEINRICRQYDVLLIVDEVVTGFGKTGNWFACDTFGIDADLITMAKGITSGYVPLSAVGIGPRVADVLLTDDTLFTHGFTNNAHPVTMAAALANISVIEDEGLVEHVAETLGPHFAAKLEELSAHPLVGEVRSCGVLGAVELTPDVATRAAFPAELVVNERVVAAAAERGVLVRPGGTSTFTFALPMITTTEQVDEIINRVRAAIEQVAAEF